jgi:hypothetical protein
VASDNEIKGSPPDAATRNFNCIEPLTRLEQFPPEGSSSIRFLAFTSDGRALVAMHGDQVVRRDPATGEVIHRSRMTLAVSDLEGTIQLIDVETGKEACGIRAEGRTEFIALSPDGRTLAAPDDKGTVWLRDPSNADAPPARLPHPEPIESLLFSPDSRTVLTWGTSSGAARLVDAASGSERHRWDRGAEGRRLLAAFSPDGRALAMAMPDNSILLHDTAAPTKASSLATSGRADGPLGAGWDALGSLDVNRAASAFRAMRGAGPRAVAFLVDRFRPAPAETRDAERLDAAIRELDHDDVAVRERATSRLSDMDPAIEPILLRALDATRSPEVDARVGLILSRWNDLLRIPAGEPLSRYRAIRVLERIDTPDARSLLRRLRDSAPSLRERRAALSALDRLERR